MIILVATLNFKAEAILSNSLSDELSTDFAVFHFGGDRLNLKKLQDGRNSKSHFLNSKVFSNTVSRANK